MMDEKSFFYAIPFEPLPKWYYPQSTVEKLEAQRDKISCLRLHSKWKAR